MNTVLQEITVEVEDRNEFQDCVRYVFWAEEIDDDTCLVYESMFGYSPDDYDVSYYREHVGSIHRDARTDTWVVKLHLNRISICTPDREMAVYVALQSLSEHAQANHQPIESYEEEI